LGPGTSKKTVDRAKSEFTIQWIFNQLEDGSITQHNEPALREYS
jgi:hypothetical protein